MKSRNLYIFLILVVLIMTFSGCGASKADTRLAVSQSAPVYAQKADGLKDKTTSVLMKSSSDNVATEADSSTALTGTGESSEPVSNPILNERKIIRNADLTVEVENFDKAYQKLEFIIAGIGYVQETKINKEKYYISEKEVFTTKGTIIIRVDADKFGDVLKDVKGLGLLLDENIKSDDVTDQFFDIESRLRLLRYEESRLEEYLKKITDPDTIFKTEARLTEIRHEIESLTGNLNKLSNLVQLSTITINMSEKLPAAGEHAKSYWQKLGSSFTESFKGVIRFCGEFLIVIVGALPVLVLIFIVAVIAFVIYKKLAMKHIRFKTQKDKDIEN